MCAALLWCVLLLCVVCAVAPLHYPTWMMMLLSLSMVITGRDSKHKELLHSDLIERPLGTGVANCAPPL